MRRRVLPYQYNLPSVAPTQGILGQQQAPGSVSQTKNPEQQQQMPQLPTGLLNEMMKPTPYSMASELPTGQQLMDNYIGAMGPASPYAAATAETAPNLGFSTPYLDGLAGGYESMMPASGAFSLGSAGTDFGMGVGAGSAAGEAALGGGAAAGGAAAEGAAAGSTAASGAATGAMAAIPVWGWAALAASLAKSQVQGSDRTSPAGVLDTLLMPSIDQWMNDPVRSNGNILDPAGTVIGDLTGFNDDPWYSLISPAGFAGLFD